MSMDLETRIRIAIENSEAVENIGDVKKSLKDLKSLAFEAGAAGSASLDKIKAAGGELSDKMADVNQSFKSFGSDTKKLDTIVQGVQAIGAGFQIVQGASALFGEKNKELEKTLVKLNATMAIANGLQQAASLIQKETALGTALMTAAQTAYNVVIGTSTGLLKLFRIALISTGVGALVVGLGLLIANFDEVKKTLQKLFPPLEKIGEFFKAMFQNFTDFIGVTSDATRAMDKMTDAADKSLAKNKKFMDEHGDQIDEFTKKKIEAVDRYNEAIKKDGANLVELNKRLQREIVAIDKERAVEVEKNRAAAAKTAADNAQKVYDKMLKDYEKSLQDRQKLLDKQLLQGEAQIYRDYANGVIKSQEELDKKLEQNKIDNNIKMVNLLFKEADEVRNNDKLKAEEKLKLLEELNAKLLKLDVELNKAKAKERTEAEKEELKTITGKKKDVEDAIKGLGEDIKNYKPKGDKKFGEFDEKGKKRLGDISKGISQAQSIASEISGLLADASANEIANIQNETNEKLNALEIQKNAGILSEEEYQKKKGEIQTQAAAKELAAKKKAFAIDKAMRISQAVMGTAQAVIAGMANGFPLNIIMAALAGAVGAAQIAIIAGQSFNGGGGGGSTNVSAPSAGGGAQAAPQPSAFFGLGKSNLNAGGGKGDSQRVYVVESDITNVQGRMAKTRERSTLGG